MRMIIYSLFGYEGSVNKQPFSSKRASFWT